MRRPAMNAPVRLPITRELDLHGYAVDLLRLCAKPGVVWFHVPNGESRSVRTGAKLKRMGVRRGVGDLCLVIPLLGRTAFLELKSIYGSQSRDQRSFEDDVTAAGAFYATAASPEEVSAILKRWQAIR